MRPIAVLVAMVAVGVWLGTSDGTESPVVESPQSPPPSAPPEIPASPAPAREAAVRPPVEPAAPVVKPDPKSDQKPDVKPVPTAASKTTPPVAPRPEPMAAAKATAPATVDDAGMCTELSTRDWRCTAASRPVDPGQLFFYTRVKSPANLTVEHRWYWGDRLHRMVSLYIQANDRVGFRTYSRMVVKPGEWRVEVRTKNGAVLHQEAFTVR
jgi:hypothetical protein